MDRPGTHCQKKTKNAIFNTYFLFFFTKNVKMKTNHPKTFIQHQFLCGKTKIRKISTYLVIFTRPKKLKQE